MSNIIEDMWPYLQVFLRKQNEYSLSWESGIIIGTHYFVFGVKLYLGQIPLMWKLEWEAKVSNN